MKLLDIKEGIDTNDKDRKDYLGYCQFRKPMCNSKDITLPKVNLQRPV